MNSRFISEPFLGVMCIETGEYYDESGEYNATMTFDNETKARIYYAGASEARYLIFDMIFGGDSKTEGWLKGITELQK